MQDSPHLVSCDLNGVIPFEEETPGNDSSNRITCPPENEIQWPLTITGAVDAWDEVPSSSDVIIAILDSGCDTDHPEYATSPRIHYGRDWTNKNYPGWPEDYNGMEPTGSGKLWLPPTDSGLRGSIRIAMFMLKKSWTAWGIGNYGRWLDPWIMLYSKNIAE